MLASAKLSGLGKGGEEVIPSRYRYLLLPIVGVAAYVTLIFGQAVQVIPPNTLESHGLSLGQLAGNLTRGTAADPKRPPPKLPPQVKKRVAPDHFVFYLQFDPRWKNKPYGSGHIGPVGCGPTAMAMVISTFTGKQLLPDAAAAYAASAGMYQGGSSWDIAPVMAHHWGLKATPVIGSSTSERVKIITDAVRGGAYAVAAGDGSLPWTSQGHYIVIRGIAPDGKWLIADPGHSSTSDDEWDPSYIASGFHVDSAHKSTSIYIISR